MTPPGNGAEARADVVVLTAMDLEYAAVRAHLTGLRTFTDTNGTRYEIGQLPGTLIRVALAQTGPGALAAAAMTIRAITRFQPNVLVFVGVAGGLGNDIALGDVVVATRVHYYPGEMVTEGGFQPRPRSWPLSHALEQDARDVAREGTWTSLLGDPATAPMVHFKPIVSGDVVLDARSTEPARLITEHYGDAVAIDMESAGVAAVAHHSNFHSTITVRGISDHIDAKRGTDAGGWQPRAAAHAAAFATALAARIVGASFRLIPAGASPYRGLAPFGEDGAGLFFGRAETTDALIGRVRQYRFVAVVGRSGSGKSSLVNAGLVPRLRRQGDWAIARLRPLVGVPAAIGLAGGLLPLLRPGLDPSQALAHQAMVAQAITNGQLAEVVGDVLKASGADRLVVCVDQFDEIVAWGAQPARDLAGLLVQLATGPAPVHVVLTMRTEALDIALHQLHMGEVIGSSVFLLTPMTAAQLRDAIERPVRGTGVTFEPGLASRILDDARDAPGALPLIQFALTRLWDEHDHGRLTHHAYDAFGGIGGVLASYAEQVYDQLDDETQRDQARRLLVQLVRPEGDDVVRRTARGSELAPELLLLATHLATTRLLVTGTDETGETTIDLAHATLATHWQRLRYWLAEEREFRAWQEDLRESIRRAEPLRAAQLTSALHWLRTHPHGIPDLERRFIHMSLRRHRWRTAAWRGLLVIVVGLLVSYGLRTGATSLAGAVAVTLLLGLVLGSVDGLTFWLLLRGIRPNSWRHARKGSRGRTGMRFPDFTEVTVYTSNDNGEPLRNAVVELLEVAGFEIVDQDEPVHGSWFQRLFVRGRDADASRKLSALAEEAVRAAQLKYISTPRSESDEREANAIARLVEATRMVDEAVVCTSSILLIKTEGRLVSRVLTEAEIRTLQRDPELMRSPQELLRSLARTTGVNPSPALEPEAQTPDALPAPAVSNATTSCPTCGYHPIDPQDRWQQRRDLDITWLSIDPHDQTQVIERRHCRQCRPHERIRAVACEICGCGPVITNELAERTINGTPPEPVLNWLRSQGWHDSLGAHLICTDHDVNPHRR